MRELFNVKTEFISLIESGANRKKFKIFKSADFKGEELPLKKKGRYAELAEKFYKEGLVEKIKESIKDWFDRMRKVEDEIDIEEKGGGTMNKEAEEKKLEEQKKAKAEEERIKAEKAAKEKEEKAAEEALKVKVAEAVASVLQGKENREELKGLIEKVEKGEEIKPEEMTKLREALDLKKEEKPEEMAKKIEELEAKVKKLEMGKKKSVTGQDDEPEGTRWPSFQG